MGDSAPKDNIGDEHDDGLWPDFDQSAESVRQQDEVPTHDGSREAAGDADGDADGDSGDTPADGDEAPRAPAAKKAAVAKKAAAAPESGN